MARGTVRLRKLGIFFFFFVGDEAVTPAPELLQEETGSGTDGAEGCSEGIGFDGF